MRGSWASLQFLNNQSSNNKMDFIAYLNPIEAQVYVMASKRARIVENSAVCKTYDIFGFFRTTTRELSICTSRIKRHSSWSQSQSIKQTLMHESVHLAQACKSRFRHLEPLGISRKSMTLSDDRLDSLRKVLAFDPRLLNVDYEAFYLEDKPEKVKYVVRKYCF